MTILPGLSGLMTGSQVTTMPELSGLVTSDVVTIPPETSGPGVARGAMP